MFVALKVFNRVKENIIDIFRNYKLQNHIYHELFILTNIVLYEIWWTHLGLKKYCMPIIKPKSLFCFTYKSIMTLVVTDIKAPVDQM